MSEPLTAEEIALLRESCDPQYRRIPMPESALVRRLLATLDAARDRPGLDVETLRIALDLCGIGVIDGNLAPSQFADALAAEYAAQQREGAGE